jgi:hypothetical protein
MPKPWSRRGRARVQKSAASVTFDIRVSAFAFTEKPSARKTRWSTRITSWPARKSESIWKTPLGASTSPDVQASEAAVQFSDALRP